MTLFQVSFANESEPAAFGIPSLEGCSGSRRFSLKKRSNDQAKMASYNSAFLSGLFADVARVSSSQDEEESPATPAIDDSASTTATKEEIRLDQTLPSKRSRVSLTKSLSRCSRSCKNLAEVISPVGVEAFESEAPMSVLNSESIAPGCSPSMERMNSLHFQLNCVDPSPSPKSVKSVIDIIDMAFPHLPATVSDSSCSRSESPKQLLQQQDLTQVSDQQVSDSETSSTPSADATATGEKDSYGWFVELETDDQPDSDQDLPIDPYKRTSSSMDLAFTAPTAPKRISNVEAEVEWAKAADTVDDVLGDFF